MKECIITYKIRGLDKYLRIRTRRFQPAFAGYPKLPKPYVYMHTCHNAICSNPKHIKVGTKTDNLLDTDVAWTGTYEKYPCGHSRTKENTYSSGKDHKLGKCATCSNVKRRERYRVRKEH